MKTTEINGRTCHIKINGADLPTIYWGETQNSSIYLSLGDREEKARDRIIATVGDCTRRQYELVCGDKNVSRHILEWNAGGHFNEPEKRIAKGIRWYVK